MARTFSCISAVDASKGIGKNNAIPWNLPKEMEYFETTTKTVEQVGKKNALIMGRLTYESAVDFLPFHNRITFVLSTKLKQDHVPPHYNVVVVPTLTDAMEALSQDPYQDTIEKIWIAGGTGVYREALESPLCDQLFLTQIDASFDCDVFFPGFHEEAFEQTSV